MHRLASDVDENEECELRRLEDGLGDNYDSDAGDIDYGWLDQDDEEQVDSNGRAAADYFEFFVALESAARVAAAEARGKSSRGGRPANTKIDLLEFTRVVVEGATEAELCSTFGCHRNRVYYLKRTLGLAGFGKQGGKTKASGGDGALPSVEQLEARWTADSGPDSLHRLPVSKALTLLAAELGVSINALRRHMHHVSFSPTNPSLEGRRSSTRSVHCTTQAHHARPVPRT